MNHVKRARQNDSSYWERKLTERGAFAELEKTGEDSEMGKGKKLSFGSIVIKLFVTILIWDGKEEIEWGWGSKEKFILWM